MVQKLKKVHVHTIMKYDYNGASSNDTLYKAVMTEKARIPP